MTGCTSVVTHIHVRKAQYASQPAAGGDSLDQVEVAGSSLVSGTHADLSEPWNRAVLAQLWSWWTDAGGSRSGLE